MSRKSESKKAVVARRIAEDFRGLDPEDKRQFVDETLTVLLKMKPKQVRKLLKKFAKRGRPSVKDLETVNQLIVCFLYSVKQEFMYHYATMVYKGLKQPIPEDLPEKLERVRQFKYIHMPMTPELYDKLRATFEKLEIPFDEENPEPWNTFFDIALKNMLHKD